MKTSIIAVVTLLGAALAAPVFAQRAMGQDNRSGARMPMRELPQVQHQQLRGDRQQRRDALSQMPLEERR